MLSVSGARPFAARCSFTSATTCCSKVWLSTLPLFSVPVLGVLVGEGVGEDPTLGVGVAVGVVPVLGVGLASGVVAAVGAGFAVGAVPALGVGDDVGIVPVVGVGIAVGQISPDWGILNFFRSNPHFASAMLRRFMSVLFVWRVLVPIPDNIPHGRPAPAKLADVLAVFTAQLLVVLLFPLQLAV